ncbi:MAG: hypothetical protein JW763_06315 [candidate division Zixibacteria bacterium]|nr:hypothetical protein [candidate division Zixibacteria bacterium]
MKNKEHIIDLLTAYVCGTLSSKERQRVESWLRTDREAVELYELVRHLHRTGKTTDWQQTQDTAAKLSKRLFDDFQKRKKAGPMRGITVFDSQMLPLPEGVRPATVSTRRLKYAFADMNLDISLYPVTTDSYELIGRIAGLESYDDVTVMLRSGKSSFTAPLDRHGLFRLERIPTQTYTLTVKSGKRNRGMIDIEL